MTICGIIFLGIMAMASIAGAAGEGGTAPPPAGASLENLRQEADTVRRNIQEREAEIDRITRRESDILNALETTAQTLHRHRRQAQSQDGDEPLRQEIGKILGLHVVDKTRKNVNQIHCGEPVSLVIDYELYKPIERLALGISFSLPTGLWLLHFNTIADRFLLQGSSGLSSIVLNIPQMNLSPSDYDISVRLMDAMADRAIDNHHCRYKLIIDGVQQPGNLIQLEHDWDQNK